jgi:general secretion pathway protein K
MCRFLKPRSTTARGAERGFALLLVIWVLALVALLAAGVAADSNSETVGARYRLDRATARAQADSGIALAIVHLLDPDPTKRMPADGRTVQLTFANATIAVTVDDEGGKVDLNTAPLDLVGGLADELGIEPPIRSALLAGIATRRQAFAKVPSSATPGLDMGSVDPGGLGAQAFADISELQLLPGMTQAGVAPLLPYLTVYSESATINPITAPRAVLLAVPGISPQDVGFFLGTRSQNQNSVEKPALSGADRYVEIAPLRAVTITARATIGTNATFTRQAVVLISPNLLIQPYRILRWQQPHDAPVS